MRWCRVLLALVAGAAALAPTPLGLTLAPGDLAPPLVGASLQGWKYRANWQEAPLTIVNFWATWCAPCKTEMPVLQELHTKHAGDKLAVVGVILDPANDRDVAKFGADLGISYPLVRGTQDVSNMWGSIHMLPTTFLVNGKGRIVRRYVGAGEELVASLRADVEAFFQEAKKAPRPPASEAPPKN